MCTKTVSRDRLSCAYTLKHVPVLRPGPDRLIWFHVAAITLFSALTLGQVLATRPIAAKATLTPLKGLALLLGYVVILGTYIASNRARAVAAEAAARGELQGPEWGAGEWLMAAVAGGAAGGGGLWCFRGVTARRAAEARNRELEREFFRVKFEKTLKQQPHPARPALSRHRGARILPLGEAETTHQKKHRSLCRSAHPARAERPSVPLA